MDDRKVIALCEHNLDGVLSVYNITDHGKNWNYVHIVIMVITQIFPKVG